MKRLALLLLISIVCSAYPARAQQIALELGAVGEASTLPRACGSFTVLLASDADALTRSYTTFEQCPASLGTPSYRTRTGIERAVFQSDLFELSVEAQAGVSTGAATTGDFREAGNLSWKPPFAKGTQFRLHGGAAQVAGQNTFIVGVGWRVLFGK